VASGGKLAGFFPTLQQVPRTSPSTTYVHRLLVSRWSRQSNYARSLIHSSSAKVAAADYQFYPTKMVKVNNNRAATGIFNMVDTKTGVCTEVVISWPMLSDYVELTVSIPVSHSVASVTQRLCGLAS
jgi:hypothetical protein